MKKLIVAGIGAGNYDGLTVAAVKTLEGADLIVGYTVYCDLIKPYFPDKEFVSTPMMKEIERCRIALEHAASGKLTVMICASALIGICVSIGGSIAFVGLIIPHIVRLAAGPNHRTLLPVSMFAGAVFLMLADLTARILLNPLELPIGVVTSFVGSILFVYIFYRTRAGS